MKTFILLFIPCFTLAAGPKYSYPYPRGLDDEMHNIYRDIPNKTTTPGIYLSAGAPSFAPSKVGDIDISTTTSKVYVSTSAATSSSWVLVN